MKTIKAPATSANLGPGFDCMGLALSLYNTYEVELIEGDTDILENVEDRFNNSHNLFLEAYYEGIKAIQSKKNTEEDKKHEGKEEHIRVNFKETQIPVSRGLGSSSAIIAGGLQAASVLHDNVLSRDEIFQIASEMEGHPDNAAPCIYGGLTVAMKTGDRMIAKSFDISDKLHFTVLIPDFEVSTEEARKILPETVPRGVSVFNTSHALLLTEALKNGDIELLKEAAVDQIHEPYRKKLIRHFDEVQRIAEKDADGRMLICGSGSTCLLISANSLSQNAKKEIENLTHWNIQEVSPAMDGVL